MSKVVISNMMRCRNKQSFFALYQIQTKIHKIDPNIDVEFHILWDTDNNIKERQDDDHWSNLIDKHIHNLVSYDRQFFRDYVKNYYGQSDTSKFEAWGPPSYHIFMGHYLRRVKLFDYYLIYDDDVLLNDDFSLVLNLILNKVPVLISEPMNSACDKVLFNKLVEIYGGEFVNIYRNRNPHLFGFNAGFQGIDLAIYDQFLSVDRFEHMLSLFDMRSPFREDGTEIWGDERFKLDTQQQSFFSLMNTVLSRNPPHILDPNEYFVAPSWGRHPVYGELNPQDELDGWTVCLKSKISHFIGHTHGQGKPRVLLKKIDEYLQKEGFEL
jgi:hypothetical protein